MARFFVATGHSSSDPGAVANGTTEHNELRKIIPEGIKLARPHLKSGDTIVEVPAVLGYVEAVQWYLARANRSNDYFVEVHLNSNVGTPGTGTEIWIRSSQPRARTVNDGFVRGMRRTYSNWVNRGVKSGTAFYVTNTLRSDGSILELGFINNRTDLNRLRNEGDKSLAESLLTLSHGKATPVPKHEPNPTWVDMDNPGEWYASQDTEVVNIVTGEKQGDIPKDRAVELNTKTSYKGKTWLRSKWATGSNLNWGIDRNTMTRTKPSKPQPPEPEPKPEPKPEYELVELASPLELTLRRDAHLVSPEKDFESVDSMKSGDDFVAYATFETDRKYYVTAWSYNQWDNGKSWNAIEADALEHPDEKQLRKINKQLENHENRLNWLESVVKKILDFFNDISDRFAR